MAALVPFFVYLQALGAFIGGGMAVWSELAYIRAARDGRIDRAERAHLDALGTGLRFGMVLLLLASFGLVVVDYELGLSLQPALSASYWTFITLAFLIIGVSWALSRRFVPFALGSAIIFSSWWFLAFLSIGRLPATSFLAALFLLSVATAVFYVLLHYSRFLVLRKR